MQRDGRVATQSKCDREKVCVAARAAALSSSRIVNWPDLSRSRWCRRAGVTSTLSGETIGGVCGVWRESGGLGGAAPTAAPHAHPRSRPARRASTGGAAARRQPRWNFCTQTAAGGSVQGAPRIVPCRRLQPLRAIAAAQHGRGHVGRDVRHVRVTSGQRARLRRQPPVGRAGPVGQRHCVVRLADDGHKLGLFAAARRGGRTGHHRRTAKRSGGEVLPACCCATLTWPRCAFARTLHV